MWNGSRPTRTSDDAVVGLDPHENEVLAPTGIDRKTFDAGDFHCAPKYIAYRLTAVSPPKIGK